MTTRPLTAALRTPLGARRAAVAAAALPFLFLHAEYQPSLSIPFGAATVDVRLSDEILDRIDEIVPPGTDAGALDMAYQPPAIQHASLRRRPAEERAAA